MNSASKPEVKITKGNELFLAENERLNIFATGPSADEALREFGSILVYFYEYYKKLNWDQVTGQAKDFKKIYEKIFYEEIPLDHIQKKLELLKEQIND